MDLHPVERCRDILFAQVAAERERRESAERACAETMRAASDALAAQKQAEERADGAEKDARDAAELMREAFALKAKAEERAAVLAEAMRKMRSGGLVPTFWVQFADDAIAAYDAALASQPADERGEERSK